MKTKILVPLLPVLLSSACVAPHQAPTDDVASAGSASVVARRGGHSVWGVVAGGIARRSAADQHAITWNLRDEADQVGCDLRRQLGLEWVRVDLDANTDASPAEFAGIIRRLRARGLQVLLVVHPKREDSATDRQAWINAYVNRLSDLIDNVLTGDARPEAIELGNEPNVDAEEFATAQGYAELLEQVWQRVKSTRPNAPKLVSAGINNTYFNPDPKQSEQWWTDYMNALPAGTPPFDAFAVHPYNNAKYNEDHPRNRQRWQEVTRQTIHDIQRFFIDVKGYPRQPIWVTEVGFRSAPGGDCDAANETDQASLFTLADDTLAGDSQDDHVDMAFWYSYRDDEETDPTGFRGRWGLRRDSLENVGSKPIFSTVAYRLGGEGALAPDACLSPSPPPTDKVCVPDPDALVDCGPAAGKPEGQEDDNGHCHYFPLTRTTLAGRFYTYWNQNGGLAVFGYPKSPARCMTDPNDPAQGLYSQWFERQRFEYHPEKTGSPYEILLGRLGFEDYVRLHGGQDPLTTPRDGGATSGCRWFGETSLDVCDDEVQGRFKSYWESHGLADPRLGDASARSLALFGLPLTRVRQEQSSDGNTYYVQWFERARFEWHPANADPYRVLLGLLGNDVSGR